MSEKLNTWWCLKEGRGDFMPDPEKDAELLFCHNNHIDDKILHSIKRSFSAGRPIKMLIYGDWGVGKTHLLHHIMWWLKENEEEFKAHPFFIGFHCFLI